MSRRFRSLVLASSLIGLLAASSAGIARADETGLTEEFLNDPEQIELGDELFHQQCAKCHGKGAYPGKAPRLKVGKLSAEDIYLRITYGFRKMPSWEEVFTDDQRMAIAAYVKSNKFSN